VRDRQVREAEAWRTHHGPPMDATGIEREGE